MTAPVTDPVAHAKAAIEYCYEQGWTDGLPVVPATIADVETFVATTGRDAAEIIGSQQHLGRSITVAQAAANAIMAGCKPEYFPVVLAAWHVLNLERGSRGAWQSTSGPAPLIVVNGGVRSRLGINYQGGVFGPGFRPNATIARAIGLIVRNGYGIRPQQLDQATQGLPGRWSICIGENEELSPWEPLSVVGGAAPGADAVSAMLIRTCEYVDNRSTDVAEAVLRDLAGRHGPARRCPSPGLTPDRTELAYPAQAHCPREKWSSDGGDLTRRQGRARHRRRTQHWQRHRAGPVQVWRQGRLQRRRRGSDQGMHRPDRAERRRGNGRAR
ncbi:MAG: hypothetical protein ACM3ML_27175 [Micromonosporaceae bacterium]